LFVDDPSGVTIELNFPAAEANGLALQSATTEPIGN
jgi:hypothetical protein